MLGKCGKKDLKLFTWEKVLDESYQYASQLVLVLTTCLKTVNSNKETDSLFLFYATTEEL